MEARVSSPIAGISNPQSPNQSGGVSNTSSYTGSSSPSNSYETSSDESSIWESDFPTSSEEESPRPRPAQQPAADVQISGKSSPITGSGLPVTLYDPDMLDCPICVSPLSPPVFQCENGHVACMRCCGRISNKCPSCSCPTGRLRCRWAERFLESLKVSCKYWEQGCMEKMSHNVKCDHESSCNYALFSCRHDGCDFTGISECLYTHFVEKHHNSSSEICFGITTFVLVSKDPKDLFLREGSQRTLFVLHHSVEPHGRILELVCIGNTSSKNKFTYELSATAGENTICFRGIVEPRPKLIQQAPLGKYLIVPKYFDSTGCTSLKLIIGRGVVRT